MTQEQADHIRRILDNVTRDTLQKYDEGTKTHGGGLWEKPAFSYLSGEILDLITYYYTSKEQVERLVEACQKLSPSHKEVWDALAPFLYKGED